MKKALFLSLVIFCLSSPVIAENSQPVYVVPVKGVIDLGLSSFVKRSFREAKENKARAIILEIDSFGGRVDAAVEIVDALEKIKPLPTVAFIDDHAWSAGALISLACERIIMSPGSTIGSAEPRVMGAEKQNELTDEKSLSAIRAKFKALAEQNNHPVNLAVGMVDKDFEIKQVQLPEGIKILTAEEIEEIKPRYKEGQIKVIKTISQKGKLLNLTAGEAREFGLAQNILNNRAELFAYLGLDEKRAVSTKLTWSEVLVRFLTHPIVSPLLLTLGFLGLLFELKIPGWGISGTLGLIFLGLFFWGHYLVGLAGWTEIVIFFVGILLVLIEIFVIPGFGITGVSGIILILAGIYLSLIRHPLTATKAQLTQAFYTLSFSIILTFAAVVLLWKFLPKTILWKKIVLDFSETKKAGFRSSDSLESFLGKTGKSLSPLRPSGKAVIEENLLDVITEGEFIDKHRVVKVIRVEGNKVIVKEEV